MTEQEKRETVIKGLEGCFDALVQDEHAVAENGVVMSSWQDRAKRIDAIREAIAFLKAQEPRVMTEEELRDAEAGTVIFFEQRDEVRTYLTPMIKYDDGVYENRFLGAGPEAAQLHDVRFWTSRPTDEQREAEPWL